MPEDVEMVEIRPDGTWYVPGETTEAKPKVEQKELSGTPAQVMSLDSDDEGGLSTASPVSHGLCSCV